MVPPGAARRAVASTTSALSALSDPDGKTDHRVFGRTSGGDLVQLTRFVGSTADSRVLSDVPAQPWHDIVAIRIETRASPSWVGWREIQVLAPQRLYPSRDGNKRAPSALTQSSADPLGIAAPACVSAASHARPEPGKWVLNRFA